MDIFHNRFIQVNDEGDVVLGDYDLQVKPGYLVDQVVIMDIGSLQTLVVVHTNII